MDLLSLDRNDIWHPYTNTSKDNPLYLVNSASGVEIYLESGQTLIDGMSSWWAVIHGYNHPELNQAAKNQIDKMSHVMFGSLTHEPAIKLAQKLLSLTSTNQQQDFNRVFFSDSGSVSVEVAIKMAIQYWFAQGKSEKTKLLTIRNGYHGDTFAAMSVTDPDNGMHSMFEGILAEHYFAELPVYGENIEWQAKYLDSIKQQLEKNHSNIAAVILEPLVQGAGGMKFYDVEYLRQIKALCDKHDVLLIFDEIATGFGRTGSLFAYQGAQVVPDIICLGKALTGGYMTLAATLANKKVVAGIHADQSGVLMHGPTFMANPLACAVAFKSLCLLEESNWQLKVRSIHNQLLEELSPLVDNLLVNDVRIKGAIGVVEMKKPVDFNWIVPRFVELGVWIRPFGKLIYIMPSYIIKPEQLSVLTQAIKTVIYEMSVSED
ncbi:adenosylmethionine--8-amino-7-oxononanoate transaminase [Kangiella sp. HZ709]|uniref:adenosylmethionine--8-amino-7-oxononanoate transaminase n=1 Tax=Kangiella sp. HZ709 TaxID=2666328 RepID=UPI0012B01352|nr:adenosylmethionine--8-amino-7-oxononanoate transaminase [Kangiella sp. HZ709]MRX26977.1 adenosylmethionine--8-amino-7-oxononanoate transaminase [Kangiella sp. HZ709]